MHSSECCHYVITLYMYVIQKSPCCQHLPFLEDKQEAQRVQYLAPDYIKPPLMRDLAQKLEPSGIGILSSFITFHSTVPEDKLKIYQAIRGQGNNVC